jgi:hypothetical protein
MITPRSGPAAAAVETVAGIEVMASKAANDALAMKLVIGTLVQWTLEPLSGMIRQ